MSSPKTSPLHRTMKLAVLTMAASATLVAAPAHALDTVWDPGVNTTLVSGFASTTSAVGSVTAELQSILAYLMGVSNGGNGLVETISSINDKLAHANANGDQQQAFDDTNSRRRMADQMMIQSQLARVPSADGCAETAYAGGRGAAAGGTATSKAGLDQTSITAMTGTHDQLKSMAQIVLSRPSSGFCLSTDVATGRGGCSSQGTMPGADVQTTSLTQGAVVPGQPTNQSLTTAQQKAAQAVINNIATPFPPEQLPSATAEKSVWGGKYLAMMYVMASRASAAVDALTSIASINYANPALATSSSVNAASGQFGQTWQSAEVKTLYAKLFPNQVYPTNPSEWEMLRYDIFSRYADADGADSWQAKSASFKPEEALREIARMEAIQLRLSELQIERQQDSNKILAALLAQQLQPVTTDSLHAAYMQASTASSK